MNIKNQNFSQQIKLLIFDFWGTLAYPAKNNPEEFYSFLRNFGFKIRNKEEEQKLSSFFSKLMCFSKSWENLSRDLLKEFKVNTKEDSVLLLINSLKEKIVFKLYDDVEEAFGLPFEKAILTDSASFLVEASGLQKEATLFIPAKPGGLKPDPKVFLKVLNTLKIKPKETIMVGDSIRRDLVPAEKLGIKSILIDRENKFPSYTELKINSLNKLKDILYPGL